MRVLNFGSLNIDHVYQVDHVVRPGETLPSARYQVFAGGKGANQSAALALAGAAVFHAGQVGPEGRWLVAKLAGLGVDMRFTRTGNTPTGHALIQVDPEGRNAIVLFPGANQQLTTAQVDETLATFGAGDLLLLQNETNLLPHLISQAKESGLQVCLNPAPFTAAVASYPLDLVDILVVNEIEGEGLSGEASAAGIAVALARRFPATQVVLTLGEHGVIYRSGEVSFSVPAPRVRAVDTTAAGDTFIGYFLAGLAAGRPLRDAVASATAAASLAVTRAGAMDSIPGATEVESWSNGVGRPGQ
ncbi:MAG: ribokinase [Candidatus Latescibacteria bacterium]|nr:ribokinase [Candidatus Latescibacterota bacterium]